MKKVPYLQIDKGKLVGDRTLINLLKNEIKNSKVLEIVEEGYLLIIKKKEIKKEVGIDGTARSSDKNLPKGKQI
jgi:hypothetical protein